VIPDPEVTPTIDVVEAGKAFGLGRSSSYALARRNEFPVRVFRVGSRYRVSTAECRAALGLDERPSHRQTA